MIEILNHKELFHYAKEIGVILQNAQRGLNRLTNTEREDGGTRENKIAAVVGGWETVSVPAGTFQVIKIMINNEVKYLQTGQATSGTDTSWYAPGARRYMKMILPPLEKGDQGGFFRWMASKIPPGPPFSKGGKPNH